VADDLVPGGVEDRGLAFDDRDERVGRIADLEQLLADLRPPFLADLRQRRKLRLREHAMHGTWHPARLPP
jgi:hypothetical protein